jgi:GNAT superfamily N-acetyltransferase
MPAPIQIRTATPQDAEVIVRFNALMAEETEARALDPARLRPGVASVLANAASGVYFVAVSGAEVIGQVLITYEWSDWRNANFWWLQSVYVQKAFRGQGVFKALFRHVRALASDRKDVCGFRLYVDSRNSTAKAAYERLGLHATLYEVLELAFDAQAR